MDPNHLARLQATYDTVAEEYTRRIAGELAHKPLDRQLLLRLATRLRGRGPICDLGCGPGHVGAFLHACGADVLGIDLSPAMVAQARARYPALTFQVGNLLALDVPAGAWAGIAAFYSLIHLPRTATPTALRELRRVLQPGGLLLAAFHIGDEVRHLDEWWGHPADADFTFFQPEEMQGYMAAAGFTVEDTVVRDAYPEVEHPSRRAYLLARNPEAA